MTGSDRDRAIPTEEDEPTMSDRPPTPEGQRPNPRNGRQHHAVILAIALAIYALVLWFGITVVGDSVARSSLMAGVIVILIGMWYLTARRSSAPDK
jgi:hypothetical protein